MSAPPTLRYGQRGRVVTEELAGRGLRARLRQARRHWLKRRGMRAIRRLRGFLGRQSLVGDPVVFDAAALPFLAPLEVDWKLVRDELIGLLADRERLPPLHAISPDAGRIADDSWKTFVFYGFGTRSDRNCSRCPETARLLAGVPGIQNAWFSVIGPDARIPGHRGISKGLIRAHLGLIVPDPRDHCTMRLGERIVSWEEGRLLVFDDTLKHAVWNASDQERAVLLLDFERPMRPLGRLVGRVFLWAIRRHGYYTDALARQAAWEERYYGERSAGA